MAKGVARVVVCNDGYLKFKLQERMVEKMILNIFFKKIKMNSYRKKWHTAMQNSLE